MWFAVIAVLVTRSERVSRLLGEVEHGRWTLASGHGKIARKLSDNEPFHASGSKDAHHAVVVHPMGRVPGGAVAA